FILGSLFIFNCAEDTLSPEEAPVEGYNVVNVSLPDTIWTGINNYFLITATVEGELRDVALNVVGEFRRPDDFIYARTIFLNDNGVYFDNAPGDFVFSRLYESNHFYYESTSYQRMSGVYEVEFFVSRHLLPFRLGESYTKQVYITNEAKDFPPYLSALTLPDTIDISNSSITPVTVKCFDYGSLDEIQSVTGNIYLPYSPTADHTIEFNDNGTGEDQIAGDSVFTAVFPHDIVNEEGVFSILVEAYDQTGQRSNELFKEIYVKGDFENYPPEIISVTIPDSIEAADISLLLECEVTDQNGLTNIDRVYFETIKPDGSASSGNPFPMWDDGGNINQGGYFSGDQTSDDGIYSLRINLSSTQDLGAYTFSFTAVDKSGVSSETVTRTIVIY
ncbi:MAG: hypothetical protein GY863_01025, partial [bacterium]|nr:hypothetical protein [bacterium]